MCFCLVPLFLYHKLYNIIPPLLELIKNLHLSKERSEFLEYRLKESNNVVIGKKNLINFLTHEINKFIVIGLVALKEQN